MDLSRDYGEINRRIQEIVDAIDKRADEMYPTSFQVDGVPSQRGSVCSAHGAVAGNFCGSCPASDTVDFRHLIAESLSRWLAPLVVEVAAKHGLRVEGRLFQVEGQNLVVKLR